MVPAMVETVEMEEWVEDTKVETAETSQEPTMETPNLVLGLAIHTLWSHPLGKSQSALTTIHQPDQRWLLSWTQKQAFMSALKLTVAVKERLDSWPVSQSPLHWEHN